MSFPRNAGQIPVYHAQRNTGRPAPLTSDWAKFTTAYLDCANTPLYPFGHGLGYSSVAYSNIEVDKPFAQGDETVKASVYIRNTGKRDIEETAQLYIGISQAELTQPVRQLKGFQKIHLKPGEVRKVTFEISTADLEYPVPETVSDTTRIWNEGSVNLFIGSSALDGNYTKIYWAKPPGKTLALTAG